MIKTCILRFEVHQPCYTANPARRFDRAEQEPLLSANRRLLLDDNYHDLGSISVDRVLLNWPGNPFRPTDDGAHPGGDRQFFCDARRRGGQRLDFPCVSWNHRNRLPFCLTSGAGARLAITRPITFVPAPPGESRQQ